MFNTLIMTKDYVKSFIEDKKGAVAFEYVLIIGGISVVVVGLLAVGASAMFPQLVVGVCNAFNGVLPTAGKMFGDNCTAIALGV